MDIRKVRFTLFASLAAVCAAMASLAPVAAQQAPSTNVWTAGPDAKGSNTIVGRIDPRPASPQGDVAPGASVLVSGWAADTTATGWAGISGVEVWSGSKASGTKLATGTVGLNRPDVVDTLGANFARSGFSATLPASELAKLTPGRVSLNVYVSTPDKGSYSRTLALTLREPVVLEFPTDPMIGISKPLDGTAITQKQPTSNFTFSGWALDRNPITNPATQLSGPGCSGCTQFRTQARGAGIASIVANIDSPTAARGDNSVFGNFGTPCTSCLYGNILVSNKGQLNRGGLPAGSIITREFGEEFDFAGWTIGINPLTLEPGFHTLYVTATSSVTGKQTSTSTTFQVLDLTHTRVQP